MKTSQRRTIPDFKDLHCWQKSMELAKRITPLTYDFPPEHEALSDLNNISCGHGVNLQFYELYFYCL